MMVFEDKIRKIIAKQVRRGRIEVSISITAIRTNEARQGNMVSLGHPLRAGRGRDAGAVPGRRRPARDGAGPRG